MNDFKAIGTLVNKPIVKYSPKTQKEFCHFTLAIEKNNESKGSYPYVDFIDFIAFDNNANNLKNCKKGDKVLAIGSIQNRSYIDKRNQKRYVAECFVDELQLIKE